MQADLEEAWRAVIGRLKAEGFETGHVLETMLTVAVTASIEENGYPAAANAVLSVLRGTQTSGLGEAQPRPAA